MKITTNAVQHLPAIAVRRDAAACSWAGFPMNGLVAAADAGATRSAKPRTATAVQAVATTSYVRTAPFLIRSSSPPV